MNAAQTVTEWKQTPLQLVGSTKDKQKQTINIYFGKIKLKEDVVLYVNPCTGKK